MTDDDSDTDGSQSILSRREMLSTTGFAAASMAAVTAVSENAAAQTQTEPRISLGPDYTIDDDPNGNGDLVVSEGGSEVMRWDSDAGQWVLSSLSTEEIDIGDSDFVATGEVLPLGAFLSNQGSSSTSSTSYSFASNIGQAKFVYDDLYPSSPTIVFSVSGDQTGSGDIRIQNTTDGETVLEVLDFTSTDEHSPWVTYTPTTTESLITLQVEIRSRDGNQTQLFEGSMWAGIQL